MLIGVDLEKLNAFPDDARNPKPKPSVMVEGEIPTACGVD
jgi:hypothetical protein